MKNLHFLCNLTGRVSDQSLRSSEKGFESLGIVLAKSHVFKMYILNTWLF